MINFLSLVLVLSVASVGTSPSFAQGQTAGSPPIFFIQYIHALAGEGPLDLYLDDDLVLESLKYGKATEFIPYLRGTYTLSWYPAGDTENVVASGEAEFEADMRYVHAIIGEPDTPVMLLRPNARETAHSDGKVEIFTIHGAPDLGKIDIRLRNPVTGNILSLLHNNLQYAGASIYHPLEPRAYNYEITSSNNDEVFDVYYFNFSGLMNYALTFVLSGRGQSHEEGLTLTAYDRLGNVQHTVITTGIRAPGAPRDFMLGSNYPDPFQARTTVPYSLEKPARVRLEILNLLGQVIAVPLDAWRMTGDHVAGWDGYTRTGARAPSGVYLYRLTSGGRSQTRSLVLLR